MSTPSTVLGEVRPEHDCPHGSVLVTLYYQRSFALPIGEVWAALTEPDVLARWYGRWTGDPESGRVRLTMTDEHDSATTDVRIVECAGPRLLAVDVDGWRLELRLRQVGRVTTLEFTHRHVPRSEAAEIGPGWQYYLDRLDALLAGQREPRWADYPELGEAYR
ncbi:SRPBCC domain-containing protein [Rhodococcus sp. O3]|uniref:SRPBCC domain-containing protein n=1 Tax=Rhodococcus sp. O3 TaxID=3404919 RepID=UPI003B6711F2